jgi:hypothetical protein
VRRLLAAVCAALTVYALVTACSSATATPHGRVTAKDHEPSRTTWTTGTRYRHVCTTTSRTRSCRQVPNGTRRIIHRSPECWGLDLDTGDHVCVTAHKWLKVRVGDRI